jgi:hypothetical protein
MHIVIAIGETPAAAYAQPQGYTFKFTVETAWKKWL